MLACIAFGIVHHIGWSGQIAIAFEETKQLESDSKFAISTLKFST